jgi:hypothetical protein
MISVLWVLLVAQPSAAPSTDSQATLIEEITEVVAKIDCPSLNAVWREASRHREGSSDVYRAALDNLHARRSLLGCLKGCRGSSDCPAVIDLASRWRQYQAMHKQLQDCLENGNCPDKDVDELQAGLRTIARVLLAEIKPRDRRWPELVASFGTVVGFDTSLGSLLTALSHLTPRQRTQLDWGKLSHALGTLVDALPPDKIDADDLARIFAFVSSVLGSEKGVAGTDVLDRLRLEWNVVLAIMDKTRSAATRAAIDRTLDTLIKRYASDAAKAKRYRNLQIDLQTHPSAESATKVARVLDVADLEAVQHQAERASLFPIVLAEYRAERLYTTVDLPDECPDKNRPKNAFCSPIYSLVDQFCLVLDGRALSGTTPLDSAPLDAWLAGAKKALRGDKDAPKTFSGQFAGGVGLQVRAETPGSSTLKVRAAFVAQTLDGDPLHFDEGEELRAVDVAHEPDVGRELAESVVRRSSLLKAFDRSYFKVPEVAKGEAPKPRLPPPTAAWALLSAGTPLLLDGSKTNDWAGVALSAADTLALVASGYCFIQAKNNRDDYASGKLASLAPANDQYAYALGFLATAGILKGVGVLSTWLFAEGREP